MTRITVLAGAAAAVILLGCAMLNADTRWENHAVAGSLTIASLSALPN